MPHKSRQKRLDYARRRYHSSPEIKRQVQTISRFNRWKRNFKVDDAKLMEMLDSQKDLCAACGEPFVDGFGAMHLGNVGLVPTIDHDHSCCPGEKCCGKCVRGIVHLRCNRMMGMLVDSPEILRKCADYLERTRNLNLK